MAAFTASHLSQENILRDVHDPVAQVLRTSSTLTLPSGGIDIAIDQATDSIKLGDGTNLITSSLVNSKRGLDVNVINNGSTKITNGINTMSVNADGSINVNLLSSSSISINPAINIYNELLGIASLTTATIINYSIPVGKIQNLIKVVASASNIATFEVWINGNKISRKRTYFGSTLNVEFDFSYIGYSLTAGDNIQIKAVSARPGVTDYEAELELLDDAITGSPIKEYYQEVTGVAAGVTTPLIVYTAPTLTTLGLVRIDVGGDSMAQYEIILNSATIAKKRTYFGAGLSEDFNFEVLNSADGLKLNPGDVITVNVLHNRPALGSFEVRLQTKEA